GVDPVARLDQDATAHRPELDVGGALDAPGQPQQANSLLALEDLQSFRLVVGGDDHLGEHAGDLLGHGHGDGTVGRDDTAVGGLRVAGMGALVSLGDVGADRDTAGVGVLDDGDSGLGVVVGRALGGVGVHEVVVGHLLAVEPLGGGNTGAPVRV